MLLACKLFRDTATGKLKPIDLLTYYYVREHQDTCMKHDEMAAALNLQSRRTIMRSLQRLIRHKHVKLVERGNKAGNRYRALNVPKGIDDTGDAICLEKKV